jgi:hypothetical protein
MPQLLSEMLDRQQTTMQVQMVLGVSVLVAMLYRIAAMM